MPKVTERVLPISARDVAERAVDFASWATSQAAHLRRANFGALDLAGLAEEIEDLGRGEYRELRSALRVLLLHMLKWDHQPGRRSRSWANSIANARDLIASALTTSPSLVVRRGEATAEAYRLARRDASSETDLPLEAFAETCPYAPSDIDARPFVWPEAT